MEEEILNFKIETKKIKRLFNKFDLLLACIGLLLTFSFFVFPTIKINKEMAKAQAISAISPKKIDPFSQISLEAKSVYVLDFKKNKVLFQKNAEVQLPLASLTKIMTAVSALSVVPESTVITIDKEDLFSEGDSGLYADEKWRLGDLLGLTLVESSNDGAVAVASSIGAIYGGIEDKVRGREVFVSLMNELATKLGLTQTRFNNPTGLDESREVAGGYGSARDIANLFGYAIEKYASVFTDTKYSSLKAESLSAFSHTAKNTNKAVDSIPVIIASKTGYTDLAGGNLAVVFEAGFDRPIVVVVLGSTIDGRFEDVQKLAWASIEALSMQE